MAVFGEDVRSRVRPDTLTTWAEAQPVLQPMSAQVVAAVLATFWLFSMVTWAIWAVVKSLVARGAVGLVTTHDLALTLMGEDMKPQAANFHFEDHLENGELRFDYRLAPDIAKTSNALKLMRSIGLEV